MKPKRAKLGVNDLKSQRPDIAKEWHPTKNAGIMPEHVTKSSNVRVWWMCGKNSIHEWEARIACRTRGKGCPFCSGRRTVKGCNDFLTLMPEAAKEWHPTKNKDAKPEDFPKSSEKKIWWRCGKNASHEWQSSIANRSHGRGCPFCAGRRVMPGLNSLEVTNEKLASEWHPTKNLSLTPQDVTEGSGRKVWWQCKDHKDHSWRASVCGRSRGSGCPVCSGNAVVRGFNDLATAKPGLAEEWHPTKNEDSSPFEFAVWSRKKVWWQCKKHNGHEWVAAISSRSRGRGCPFCKGKKILPGFNDLQSLEPLIASEWHPSKNGKLLPTGFTRGSGKLIWWQCRKNKEHEWRAAICARSHGSGCPSCAKYGFDVTKDAWMYLMERPGEQQIGITNDLRTRIAAHERDGWTLIERTSTPSAGGEVYELEREIKKWLRLEIGVVTGTAENWHTSTMQIRSLAELKNIARLKTNII